MGNAFITRRGGGSLYSLLTVNTSESALEGQMVTVSGTDPESGRPDNQTRIISGGKALFRLKYLTTYVIAAIGATGQSTEQVIDVPYYAPINVTLMLWDGELYDHGKTFDDITGGFSTYTHWVNASMHQMRAPTVAWNADNVTLTQQKGAYYTGGLRCNNEIDLTPYKKIVFEGTRIKPADMTSNLAVYASGETFGQKVPTAVKSTGLNADGITELDVSNITGNKIICVTCGGTTDTTGIVVMKKLRLVK